MSQRIFEALASPIRRGMLVELAGGERAAGEVAARFEISKPAVSQHLSILEAAGLVRRCKRGQYVFYSLAGDPLSQALEGLLEEIRAASLPDPTPPDPTPPDPTPPGPTPPAAEAAPLATKLPEPQAAARPAPPPQARTTPMGFRWEAWRSSGPIGPRGE